MKKFWLSLFIGIISLAFSGCPTLRASLRASLDRHTFSGASVDSVVGQMAMAESNPHTVYSGLSGFHFNYDEGDRYLKIIEAGVLLNAQTSSISPIHAIYMDNNGSGSYSWRIDRVILPPFTYVGSIVGCNIWPDQYSKIIQGAGNVVAVIVGFKLHYKRNHHAVRLLNVNLNRDETGDLSLIVQLFDGTTARDYCFEVSIAFISPAYVKKIDALEVIGTGSFERDIDAENPILKSFWLSFPSGGKQLDEIGVLVSPGKLRGWFNDSGHDDQFRIHVKWVELQPEPRG